MAVIQVTYVDGLHPGRRPEEMIEKVTIQGYGQIREYCRMDVATVIDEETGTRIWQNPLFRSKDRRHNHE